ncbi:MAG: hypothetical protein ACSLFM_11690, partial [Tepidiformaceae bacterium]
MNRTLEDRLTGLQFSRPPLLAERALAGAGRRGAVHHGRGGRAAAVVVAGAGVIVGGNFAVAAISPAYARVLAD